MGNFFLFCSVLAFYVFCICMTISFPSLGNFPAMILLVFFIPQLVFISMSKIHMSPIFFLDSVFQCSSLGCPVALTLQPGMRPQRSSCLYLPSTEIKGTWLNPIFLYYICIFLFFLFSYYSDLVILSSNEDPLSST